MSTTVDSESDSNHPPIYQIRLKGHLGQQWTDWFEGMTLVLQENGETLLTGPVADQPALHGLLKKVRDLGVPLLSVNHVGSGLADGKVDPEPPDDGSLQS
jgi:hypothetical protein